jgi:hypothetical protein
MLPSPTLVHAGPLTAVFERVGLRWISHRDVEVLRSIYGAVRDAHWRTIPAEVSGLGIDQNDDGFRIVFEARHLDRQVDFVWHGTIEASASGTVVFSMDGEARSTFARNRIGLCILHPLAGWIDRFSLVEQADGAHDEVIFPKDVSPHQVMRNVRAIRNEVAPGLIADLQLSGEVFETEDQRNWSDASFKTYGTPVDLPRPVVVEAGSRISQRVTLTITEHVAEPDTVNGPPSSPPPRSTGADDEPRRKIWLLPNAGGSGAFTIARPSEPVQLSLTVETRPLPRVGVALRRAACSQTPIVRTRVASLNAAHLHVTLDTGEAGWQLDLEQAATEAAQLRLPLEVAVLTSTNSLDEELDALARLTLRLGVPLARWLVFDRHTATTSGALATLARRHLRPLAPNAPIGGGSYGHFAELNRHRPPTDSLDCLSYGLTPQAHDIDEATMMENVTSVGDVHRTIRRFAPGRSIVVSPVTLQPRPIDRDDPRQASSFAAAWTVAHLAALVEHGAEAVTYFETVGPAGVIDATSATLRPVGHVLAAVGAYRGASARLVRSSAPDAVAAFGLTDGRRAQVVVANLRAISTEVMFPGERTAVRLAPHAILQRDLGRSLAAR